jgi:hypothetical protein
MSLDVPHGYLTGTHHGFKSHRTAKTTLLWRPAQGLGTGVDPG